MASDGLVTASRKIPVFFALAGILPGCAWPSGEELAHHDVILEAFDSEYAAYLPVLERMEMDATDVYHLRRILQSLVDAWRATEDRVYLTRAKLNVQRALRAARARARPIRGRDRPWPCFFHAGVDGHSQLVDFQASAGIMIVAHALREDGDGAWTELVDFVEQSIVGKWLAHRSLDPQHFRGPRGVDNMISALSRARDNREHAASVFLDLALAGRDDWPYIAWARALVETYLMVRSAGGPDPRGLPEAGLILAPKTGGLSWLWIRQTELEIQDTSHANRTVWLASKAYSQGLIARDLLDRLIVTFKRHIWAREQGRFVFNNYVDGSNGPVGALGPSRAGNIWFGWHRLAAYDEEIRHLYIALATEIAAGGGSVPRGTQNRTMPEARLCLLAWAARLLSPSGRPTHFP